MVYSIDLCEKNTGKDLRVERNSMKGAESL